jgi:hypothetical protein
MPEALNFTEIERQHLELLPVRTLMSMFVLADGATSGNAGDPGVTGKDGNAPSTSGASADPTQQLLGPIKKVPFVGFLLTGSSPQ